jgi:hypothetical protein
MSECFLGSDLSKAKQQTRRRVKIADVDIADGCGRA